MTERHYLIGLRTKEMGRIFKLAVTKNRRRTQLSAVQTQSQLQVTGACFGIDKDMFELLHSNSANKPH
jgi:hypothetical protein